MRRRHRESLVPSCNGLNYMEDIGEEIVVGPRVSVEDKCRSEGGGTRIARVHDVFGAPSERVHDVLEHPVITNTSSGCS